MANQYLRTILLPLGTLAMMLQTPGPDLAVLHIHQALSEFLRRGQISIELFPPLSIYLGAHLHASALAWLSFAAQAGMILIVCQVVLAPVAFSRPSLGVLMLPLFGALGMRSISDSVTLSSECSDLFLVIAAATAFLPHTFAQPFCYVPAEIWVVAAMMLGWRNNDPVVLFILLFIQRITAALRMLENPSASVLRVSLNLLRQFLYTTAVSSCIVIAAFTLAYPTSEQKAGGNYNLRYLSPSARRTARQLTIHPFKELPKGRLSIPKYALIPEQPISLYIPQAGFLWTDSMAWFENHSTFLPVPARLRDPVPFPVGRANQILNFTHRAIFSDQIRRVELWALEQAMEKDDYNPLNEAITGYIWPREHIRLRSLTSGGFLGVEAGKKSIVDSVLNLEHDPGDVFQRWRVSVSSSADPLHSTWSLDYDPYHDSGFRLYNAASACFLSTSYRSFPDWDGLSKNDSVLKELKLELEATCSGGVRRQASTLFVIDGHQVHRQKSAKDHNAFWWPPKLRATQAIERTFEILSAIWKLHRFRSKFAHLQDTPPELTASYAPKLNIDPPNITSQIAHYCDQILITTYLSFCLLVKRRAFGLDNNSTKYGTSYHHLCTWFVIEHLVRRQIVSRLAAVMSLLAWRGLLEEIARFVETSVSKKRELKRSAD